MKPDRETERRTEWVEGAGQFYKHWSFWGILLLGVLPFLENSGFVVVSVVPEDYRDWATLLIAVLVAVLRFIKQNNIDRDS